MSGALTNTYNNVSFALQRHAASMARLQEQAYTGERINRASDEPFSGYRVLTLESQQRSLENYMDNITQITSQLEIGSTVVGDMVTAVSDAKVHLTQVISGTYGSGDTGQSARNRVAAEINDVLERMVSAANTKTLGQYIFGGSNSSSAPYTALRTNGLISSVTYEGGEQARRVEVSPGVDSNALDAGRDIFQSNRRQVPVFMGGTGAKAGSGTSSARGDVWLTVTHDSTNYRLSIDDGTTEVVVPNAGDVSNIPVVNADGQVLYVDATNITTTGVEMVRIPGTYDIFNALINLRDLLYNTRNLSEIKADELVNQSAATLDELNDLLVEKQVGFGSRIGFLETHKQNLDNIKFNVETEVTQIKEADVAQVAIDISRNQVLYEMSLSVAGKLLSTSLLDFI
jgi:flagellar hook-associated protein 3 FlgL